MIALDSQSLKSPRHFLVQIDRREGSALLFALGEIAQAKLIRQLQVLGDQQYLERARAQWEYVQLQAHLLLPQAKPA